MASVAPLALGLAGAFIGSFFGAPMVGFVAGEMLGSALFPGKGPDGPRLTDLKLQTSAYGQPIPIIWGTIRLAGNVIWQTDLKEVRHEHGGKGTPSSNTYSYTVSFAVLFGEARVPWTAYRRIWFNKRLVWEDGVSVGGTDLPVTLYLGGPDQDPDPTMEAVKGVGNVPAYRERGYIVFTDLDTSDLGSVIPFVEVEIQSTGVAATLGLEYYAVWDVDTDYNNVTGYSYPFVLSGQHYNQATKKIVSYRWRTHDDYGPPADYNKGIFDFAEWSHTLDGSDLVVVPHFTIPYPGAGYLPGTPSCTGFKVLSSMNGAIAYMAAGVTGSWPDGSGVGHFHYVDCWGANGSPGNQLSATYLAQFPDGISPPEAFMKVTGTIIESRDGNWIYASCGEAGDANPGSVRKYKIDKVARPGNGPQRISAAQFNLPQTDPINHPTTGVGIDICEGDDGFIYVLALVAGQPDPVMYKLDKDDLTIVYRWLNDFTDSPTIRDGTLINATTTFDYTSGLSTFAVYKDYLIVQANTQGGVHLSGAFGLSKLNYTTGYIEFINWLGNPVNGAHTSGIRSPVIYLGDGYCAVRDGILDLGGRDGGAVTLGFIVGAISDRIGQTAYDVSDLPDPVRGFAATRQGSARAVLETLTPAFFFGGVESDAVVKFKHYGHPSLGVINDDDLGARGPSSSPVSLLTTTRAQEEELPRAVYVKYLNKDADYQDGVQLFRRQVTDSQLEVTAEAAIVFTDAEAKAIADRIGTNAWIERESHTFFTPRKFAAYEPIDVVTIQGREMRITNKTEQQNGIIQFNAVASLEPIFIQAPVGVGGGFVPPVIAAPQATDLRLLDIPLPTDESNPNGYPSLMAGQDRPDWRGAQLYKSTDGGASYQSLTVGFVGDTMGYTTTALADFTGGNVFDESSSVRVVVSAGSGALASATAAAVLAGANMALIGSELLQYKTATLVATLTYDLSGFLRGRRGTEWATLAHVAGDLFSALPAQNNVVGTFSEVGVARKFKAVTVGSSVAGAEAVDFTNTGQALKPYSPVQLGGGYDGSGNVTLTWIRRTRVGGVWRDLVDAPLSESVESYIVQIWDSSYTLCARIITVRAAQTTIYTSAMQVTDFGAQQHDIYWTVGQLGSVSIGSQARGSVSGIGASNVSPLVPIAPYAFPSGIAPPGGTGVVDKVMTASEFFLVSPSISGSRWCGKFHTTSGTMNGIFSAGYNVAPASGRHAWIATDAAGLNKVPNGERWTTNSTALLFIGSGGAVLANATDYYFLFDFLQADGSPMIPFGTNSDTSVAFTIT